MEDVSNVSHSDAQQVLKDTRKSNLDKLVFGQLNVNSLRNKFDMLSELKKGFVDVFMLSEAKLDDSLPEGQFFIDGCHIPFRYDRNGNGGGIFLYVREDIPAKIIHCDFPTSESFFVEIDLYKKKWLIICSCSPYKNNIGSHLNVITKTLDTYFHKYESVVFLGGFNGEIEETTMKYFG